MNLSYNQIRETLELVEYKEIPYGFSETYMSDDKMYVCIWLKDAVTPLPSTIKITNV